MADFMNLIEAVDSTRADVQRLFGGNGERSVRTAGTRREHSDEYHNRLTEAARFMQEVISGHRPGYQLREALSTADFPYLFGDVIDRQLLANYRAATPTYRNYCKIDTTIPDFRTVKRFAIDGAQGSLAQVAELEEYPEASLTDSTYSYQVAKYGRRVDLSWEAIVNDDLGALRDLPSRLATAATRTEERFATNLFVDASGPHASHYTTGNKNKLSGNPVLTTASLQAAVTAISKLTDADGEPVSIDMMHLVVPPALAVTAENILNSTELWTTLAADTTTQLHTRNWMSGRFKVDVNAYIPIIANSANGDTSWFLFADPNVSRPAIEIGMLRGHDAPELFIKSPNATRVGGGSVDPTDGDFDNDSVAYKVRHVIGGAFMDPKATVASNGSGS